MVKAKQVILFLVVLCGLAPVWVKAVMQDPTQPFTIPTIEVNVGAYELSAILFSKDRKIAVIDGEWLTEGSTIEGATVRKITPNTVDIEGPNGKQTLVLLQNALKPTD